MPVIQIIVVLVVIGVIMYLVNTQLGQWIAQPWLKIINAVAIIFTILWLLSIFLGGVGGFGTSGPGGVSVWPFRR